jgi:hypothetical protein
MNEVMAEVPEDQFSESPSAPKTDYGSFTYPCRASRGGTSRTRSWLQATVSRGYHTTLARKQHLVGQGLPLDRYTDLYRHVAPGRFSWGGVVRGIAELAPEASATIGLTNAYQPVVIVPQRDRLGASSAAICEGGSCEEVRTWSRPAPRVAKRGDSFDHHVRPPMRARAITDRRRPGNIGTPISSSS